VKDWTLIVVLALGLGLAWLADQTPAKAPPVKPAPAPVVPAPKPKKPC
jgi:hypothetical protein